MDLILKYFLFDDIFVLNCQRKIKKKTIVCENHIYVFFRQEIESDLNYGYVQQCVRGDTTYPYRCSVPGSPGNYYTAYEAAVGTKCIAAGGSKTPDNVRVIRKVTFINLNKRVL